MDANTDILRIAAYAADPPALDALHSFDPESFVVISMIADALVYIDLDGSIQPALATSWKRDTPVSAIFELREGVRFHDGTPFGADDVVATFRAHIDPENPTIGGRGILSPIKSVTRLDEHRVRFETHFPDALLLHRFFFSQIYPAHVLASKGRAAILAHPIGTGAYALVEHVPGQRIVLRRNPDHWARTTSVEYVELPIVPQTEWVDAMARGELDVALNIDAHDAIRARRAGLEVNHAPSTLGHFFLLAPKGPLADRRVRQALNHAIHRDLLAEVSEHGDAAPSAALLGPQQYGHDPELPPHSYSVDRAKRLLAEAGYADGFTIRGVVSSTSSSVFATTKAFLARVGVTLQADIVPRSEWMRRVVVARMIGGEPFDGDFAVCNVDNPVINGLFHHFIFLFSQGPFSLTASKDYDEKFLAAATNLDPAGGEAALKALERYVHDEALALFTISADVHAASRPGVHVPLPASGHFNNAVFWRMTRDPELAASTGYARAEADDPDVAQLLAATSHPGVYFGPGREAYAAPSLRRLWDNLDASQARWSAQTEPMLRELVSAAESQLHLANVLGSTSRVAIVGYSDSGRRLFVNRGYRSMVADDGVALDDIGVAAKDVTSWADVRAQVEAAGTWTGAVTLARGDGSSARLHLTATRARDRHGAALGYTYVFSDFSGAEERVKSQAIRRIMDHVPYALFTVGPDMTVAEGYSRACDAFFVAQGDAIAGRDLPTLFGMDERAGGDFACRLEQVFDDFLPEEVTVGQLPERIRVGDKTVALTASTIRGEDEEIEGILFSAIDVTALEAAQREIEKTRAAITVLRDRERFEEIALAYLRCLDGLVDAALEDDYVQAHARRELHTFKGVFGLFCQQSVVDEIHAVEDAPSIAADQLEQLRASFEALLRDNEEIWQIRPGGEPDVRVAPSAMKMLLEEVDEAQSVAAVKARVLDFMSRALCRPVAAMIGPMQQTCTRLARRLGKEARFECEGAWVRVPEQHAEFYRVLPHLLRNALDHGMETPEARGDKPREGVVALSVREDESGYVVEFSDDGRGIDPDRVAQKALAAGAITTAQLAEMTEEQRLGLIFLPGLTTAEHTSDVSGRGIGMGAVRNVVEELGGSLVLRSVPGTGTRLSIRLPSVPANEIIARATSSEAA